MIFKVGAWLKSVHSEYYVIISSPQLEILCIGLLHALWKLQGEISSRLQQFYETCLFTITVCCQTKLFVDKKSKQFKNKTRWKYVAEYGVCRQPQVLRRPTFSDLKKKYFFLIWKMRTMWKKYYPGVPLSTQWDPAGYYYPTQVWFKASGLFVLIKNCLRHSFLRHSS